MEPLQAAWRRKGYCIRMGGGRSQAFCKIRFADDDILMARSAKPLKIVMEELMAEAETVGLELHMGESKVLMNEKHDH